MKRAAKIYTALIFVFLFAPIAILLVFSFNEAKSLSVFSGVSLKWYQELFRDGETLNALKNTLILAVIASVVSTAMGTAAALASRMGITPRELPVKTLQKALTDKGIELFD